MKKMRELFKKQVTSRWVLVLAVLMLTAQVGYRYVRPGSAGTVGSATCWSADYTINDCAAGAPVGGSGTANIVAKFTAAATIGDSNMGNIGPPAAGATGNVTTITGTLAAMDGSDTVGMLTITPTNANHTGASNTLYGTIIGAITADADATEYAFASGSGWDGAVYSATNGSATIPTFALGASGYGLYRATNSVILTANGAAVFALYDVTSTSSVLNDDVEFFWGTASTMTGDAGFQGSDASNYVRVILNAAQVWEWNLVAAATSDDWYEFATTLAAMNGSDTVNIQSYEPTNANHTGTGNTLSVINIAAITGDANSNLNAVNIGALTGTAGAASELETAINMGDGWDIELYMQTATPIIRMNANGLLTIDDTGNVTALTITTAAAGPGVDIVNRQLGSYSSTNLRVAPTAGDVMDGSDTLIGAAFNMRSDNHTGTGNTLNVISLGALTGDAHSNLNGINIGALTGTTGAASEVETAIKVGAGWDYTLEGATTVDIRTGNGSLFSIINSTTTVFTAGAGTAMDFTFDGDTNAGGDLIEIDPTVSVMDGDDDLSFMIFDAFTDANHTTAAGTNIIYGIQFEALTSPDAQSLHYAIFVNAGYQSGIKTASVTQATLEAAANGSWVYCSDCNPDATCTAAGAGAMAFRIAGSWACELT
jgi:hypothetical protein